MRIQLIKQVNSFIQDHDADFVEEAIQVLEHIGESPNLKEQETDVIGELLSNMYGGLEVNKAIKEGKSEKDALNEFMQRVVGSIDKNK